MHDPASNPNPFAVVDRATLQYLGPDEMAGETVYVLRGQLAPAALDAAAVLPTAPRYVRIWVGASDGMPRRVVYLQDGGEEMLRQEFQNVVIDAAMDQALFDFVPPPDAQVIDLTPAIVALSRTE
jgi:outer membrane lipoprotein-sorting protein